MDEAIAILELCSRDCDAARGARALRRRRRRALGDRDDDRGRLHALRAPGDGLPRRPRPADTDLDEREARGRGGERQADPLLPGPARPPARADGRRLCGARRRRDRGFDRRPVLVVGRARDRHRPARADRGVRRRQVLARSASPPGRRRTEHRRAGRLRERLGADLARGGAGPRGRLWGVRLDTSRTLVDRSLWDELGDFDPRGVNERLVWRVREALDAEGFQDVRIVVSGGFDTDRIRSSRREACPWIPTASGRR